VGLAIKVGTAGWSYKDWEGRVYPKSAGRNFDQLAYLAHYFDVVEINSTFYHPPAPRTAANWARRVSFNPEFRFTLKLWQKFTHHREGLTEKDVLAFKSGIDPLAESGLLGCVLLQFPWSFKNLPANRGYLEELIAIFRDYPRALEIRHASWDVEEVYQFLQQEGVGFCNIDQPLFSGSIEPTQRYTASMGYVRLHGHNHKDWFREEAGRDKRYDYLYSTRELKPWVEKIISIARKARQTFVITNNHFRGQAACNALQLKNMLTGGKLRIPAPLLAAFPELRGLAREDFHEPQGGDPQGSLL
jgi:uncharacterized protein YecE (DUF72 family)